MRTRFSNFELDSRRFLLERAGRRVALRPKVMDLLILLVENRERVVSREEIVEALWGGTCVGAGSLSGLVNELRKGLGERGNTHSSIRTVHARGYQFVAAVRAQEPGPDEVPGPARGAAFADAPARQAQTVWRPAIEPGLLARIEPIFRPSAIGWKGARALLVEGPVRSGRSALLAELLTYASTLGFDVHVLVQWAPSDDFSRDGSSSRGRALCDLILDTLIEKAGREVVERALPERGRVLLDRSEGVGCRLALSEANGLVTRQGFEQSARWLSFALRRLSESAPLLFALDDLDRADAESIEFLNVLLARLGDARIVFAATSGARSSGEGSDFREKALDRLARHERVEALSIRPPGKSALQSLLVARGIPPLAEDLLDRLHAHCAASPGADAVVAGWMGHERASTPRETPERRMRVVSAPESQPGLGVQR